MMGNVLSFMAMSGVISCTARQVGADTDSPQGWLKDTQGDASYQKAVKQAASRRWNGNSHQRHQQS